MTPFRFREDGNPAAPALVLANSLGADTGMWDAQVAAWRGHYRILRFDHAGHGPHAVPSSCSDAAQVVACLLGELDRCGVDTFHLVGLSLGGMLGMQLAAHAPARVRRLVLANCRYFQEEAGRAMWDQRIASVLAHGTASIVEPTLSRWFSEEFRLGHPETMAALAGVMGAVSAAGYAAAAAIVRDVDARPFLSSITAPTLVVGGAQDGAAPLPHLADLARRLGAEHLTFDPCAHLSNVECAERFTTEVGRFLAG